MRAHAWGAHRPGRRRHQSLVSCASYRFRFAPGVSSVLAVAADSALSFVPRAVLVDFVRRTEGQTLCGRGARCP